MLGLKTFVTLSKVPSSTYVRSSSSFVHATHNVRDVSSGFTKLTTEEMNQIKELREKDPVKYSVRTLAKLFNVANQTISQIAPYDKELLQKQQTELDEKKAAELKKKEDNKARLAAWLAKTKAHEQSEIEKRNAKRIINKKQNEEKRAANAAKLEARRKRASLMIPEHLQPANQ